MPLNQVARRYADTLFTNSMEEVLEKHRMELAKVRLQYGSHNVMSGQYITAHAQVLLEQIRRLAEARMDSLIKAYEKAGLPLDDAAFNEIKDEVMQFCHQKQHNAVHSIGETIKQTFHGSPPAGLNTAVVDQIIRGVDGVMGRMGRNLSIRRDEVILDEMKTRKVYAAGLGKRWDVFICHATEDKEAFVRPLAKRLEASGLSVWYDEFTLKIGDRLRQKIDDGLANSRYGVVVLSNSFFAKNWPQHELDGLVGKEITGTGTKVVLPIWHCISFEEVQRWSPMLSGRVAAKSSDGLDSVVRQLRDAMGLQINQSGI
jgi:hypothetical protein